jgi:hypothetical protein
MPFARGGTSTWNAKTSTRSRDHGISFSPALKCSPASCISGPAGMCSPGTHFG